MKYQHFRDICYLHLQGTKPQNQCTEEERFFSHLFSPRIILVPLRATVSHWLPRTPASFTHFTISIPSLSHVTYSSILKMAAALVPIHQPTRCQIPEDCNHMNYLTGCKTTITAIQSLACPVISQK
jgi:hypothetical protein